MTGQPFPPLHLGPLHTYEAVLLGILAFGPFVVLAVVVMITRTRHVAEDEGAQNGATESTEPPSVEG